MVFETEELGVPVFVIVLETDGDFVIVFDTEELGVPVRVTVGVTDGDFVIVLDTEELGVPVRVTVGIADGDFVIVFDTDAERDVDRVPVGVFVGVRLLENDGSCVGSLGIVGRAVGREGIVGSSVCGRAVGRVGSSVGSVGRAGRLGYSVLGIAVRKAVLKISGIEGYSDAKTSGMLGSSVRRVGIVSGIDPRIGFEGNSEGIAGIEGSTVVIISRGGSVGNAVEGIAGIESVGSIEGSSLIYVAITSGIDGRVVNVCVGNGLGLTAPDARTDCDGKIGGIKDGSIKPPNCR